MAARVAARLLVVVLLLSCGCGQGPKIVTVTGMVTRQGKPVPHVVLTFVPEHGRPSWGETDEQGRFNLHYDRHQEGAVVGKHTVSVQFKPRDPGEEEAFQTGKKRKPKELQAILQKYGKPDTSPLVVEITKNGQQLDLKVD